MFRSFGLAGVAYAVLKATNVRAGRTWLASKLARRYDPYAGDIAETMKCLHCSGRLEATAEGLVCQECQNVYV
jgi:hypothetical protein